MTQQTEQLSNPDATAEQPGAPGSPGTADPHLAEWDRARAAPAVSTVPKELEPVIRFAEAKMVEEVKTTIDKEVGSAVAFMRGEDYKEVPEDFVRGHIEVWAQKNPGFKKAYESRNSDPSGWTKAQEAAREGFSSLMAKMPGSSVRSDVEAARASVRGTHNAPPPPQRVKSVPELNRMSDWELAEYKRELEGRA